MALAGRFAALVLARNAFCDGVVTVTFCLFPDSEARCDDSRIRFAGDAIGKVRMPVKVCCQMRRITMQVVRARRQGNRDTSSGFIC